MTRAINRLFEPAKVTFYDVDVDVMPARPDKLEHQELEALLFSYIQKFEFCLTVKGNSYV
jgi:hypothetical protein